MTHHRLAALALPLLLAGCMAPVDVSEEEDEILIPEAFELLVAAEPSGTTPSRAERRPLPDLRVQIVERGPAGATHELVTGPDGRVTAVGIDWEATVDVHVFLENGVVNTLAALTPAHVERLRAEGYEQDDTFVVEVRDLRLRQVELDVWSVPPTAELLVITAAGSYQQIDVGERATLHVPDGEPTLVTVMAIHWQGRFVLDGITRAAVEGDAVEAAVDFENSPGTEPLRATFDLPADGSLDGFTNFAWVYDGHGIAGLAHLAVDGRAVTVEGVGYRGAEHDVFVSFKRGGQRVFDRVRVDGERGLAYEPELLAPPDLLRPDFDGVTRPGDRIEWASDDLAWMHVLRVMPEGDGTSWRITTLAEGGLSLPELPDGAVVPPGFLGIESCAHLNDRAFGRVCATGAEGTLRVFEL